MPGLIAVTTDTFAPPAAPRLYSVGVDQWTGAGIVPDLPASATDASPATARLALRRLIWEEFRTGAHVVPCFSTLPTCSAFRPASACSPLGRLLRMQVWTSAHVVPHIFAMTADPHSTPAFGYGYATFGRLWIQQGASASIMTRFVAFTTDSRSHHDTSRDYHDVWFIMIMFRN